MRKNNLQRAEASRTMPNWCDNCIEISHDDEEWWDWFMSTKFNFQKIVPCPSNIPGDKDDDGEPWSYNYSSNMWGTKWPANKEQLEQTWVEDAKGSMTLGFQTAWSPPIGIFKALHLFGFKIKASYLEEGMDYCGVWCNHQANEYIQEDYDNELSPEDIIPEHIKNDDEWDAYIKENPLDKIKEQIVEDFPWFVEDRLERNYELWEEEQEESREEGRRQDIIDGERDGVDYTNSVLLVA